MQIKKALITGLRVIAVCLLFTVCMAVGVAVSGLTRVASQGPWSQQPSSQITSQISSASQMTGQTPQGIQPAPSALSSFPFSYLPLASESLCPI